MAWVANLWRGPAGVDVPYTVEVICRACQCWFGSQTVDKIDTYAAQVPRYQQTKETLEQAATQRSSDSRGSSRAERSTIFPPGFLK